MLLIINQLGIPFRHIYCNNLGNLLQHLHSVLNLLNNPIAFNGCDIRLKVSKRRHFFNQCQKLVTLNVKLLILVLKNAFNHFHNFIRERMQIPQGILKEVANCIWDDYFAVAYMVLVILHHAEVAYKVLMGRAENISFIIWVILAIYLWK
jgi:hypothetical protein